MAQIASRRTQITLDSLTQYERIGEGWIGKPIANEGGTKKLAILFGWLDAGFKYVEKYAQWYRSKGFTVVVYIGTSREIDLVYKNTLKLEEFDEMIAYLDKDHNLFQAKPPKLALHAFSLGGHYKIKRLVNALHNAGKQLPHAHFILDSGPGRLNSRVYANFYSSMAPSLLTPLVYGAVWGYGFVRARFAGEDQLPGNVSLQYAIRTNNLEGNILGPRLFLYSAKDAVVPAEYILSNIADAKANGLTVEAKDFETSAHVKHAVDHKEEYWALVSSFLERN
ncbi:hypothetical protein BC830DRAFT_1084276 [Chytriomyces sp. MP71]|nr:hypothetical protein BC830DRAFT_1084276 [Chytriomyces sp. MP71]